MAEPTNFVIRDSQLQRLGEAALEERLVSHFFEHFEPHCRWLGAARVTDVVRLGIAKARRHGFVSEREVCLYLSVMFVLGSHFDEDALLPWAQKILREDWEPLRRIETLHRDTMYFVDDVAGEENERLVRALVRFRKVDRAAADRFAPHRLEEGVIDVLEDVYPEKAAKFGREGCELLVRRAVKGVLHYGLAPQLGTLVYASHLLLLGGGFDIDPLYPWAREVLGTSDGSPDAPTTRAHALCDRGLEFLDAVGLRGAPHAS